MKLLDIYTCFLMIFLCEASSVENVEDFEAMMNADTSDWINPMDMLNYDPTTKSMQSGTEPGLQQNSHAVMAARVDKNGGLSEGTCEHPVAIAPHNCYRQEQELLQCQQQRKNITVECERRVAEASTCPHHSVKEEQEIHGENWKKCVHETPFITRLVQILVRQLGLQHMKMEAGDEAKYIGLMTKVTASDLSILQGYIDSDNINIHDVSDILSHMFTTSKLQDASAWTHFNPGLFRTYEFWMMVISTLVLVAFYWIMTHPLSLGKVAVILILVLFIVSCFWHWMHMYKVALARRHAEVMKYRDVPAECKPYEMMWYQALFHWFKGLSGSEDPCSKYHEALLVDPFWDISPTKAVAETLTKFVCHPFEYIGNSAGRFFNELLSTVPLFWRAPVLVIVVIMMIILMLMMCGYRARAPFGLSIEPVLKPDNKNESNNFAVIVYEIKTLQHAVKRVLGHSLAQNTSSHCQKCTTVAQELSEVIGQITRLQHDVEASGSTSMQLLTSSYRQCSGVEEVSRDVRQVPGNQEKLKDGPGGEPAGNLGAAVTRQLSSRISASHFQVTQWIKGLIQRTFSCGSENARLRTEERIYHQEILCENVHDNEVTVMRTVEEETCDFKTSERKHTLELQDSSLNGKKMDCADRAGINNTEYAVAVSAELKTGNVNLPKTKLCYSLGPHTAPIPGKGRHKEGNGDQSQCVVNPGAESVAAAHKSQVSDVPSQSAMSPGNLVASAQLSDVRSHEEYGRRYLHSTHDEGTLGDIDKGGNDSVSKEDTEIVENQDSAFLEQIATILEHKTVDINDLGNFVS